MKGLLWIPALALCLQVSSKAIPPGAASDVLSGEDDLDQTIASLSKSLPKTLSVKLAGLVSDNFNEAWCLAEDVKTLSGECHPLKLAAALSSDIFSPAVSSFAPVLKRELQSGVEEFHAMNHPSAPSTLSNAKWKAKVWAHSMKRAKRLQNLLATHVTRHTKGLSSDVKVLQKQLKKKTRLQKIGGGPLIQPTPKNNAIFGVLTGLLGLPFLHLVKSPSLLWIPVLYVFAGILAHKILMGVWFPWGHPETVGDVDEEYSVGPKF